MFKKVSQFITITTFALVISTGSLVSAQTTQPRLVNKPNVLGPTSFTANYEFYGRYADPKQVYLWVGEYVSPSDFSLWDKTMLLTTIPGNTDPLQFSATIPFSMFASTSGRTFGYLLADRSVPGNSAFITQSGAPTVRCFNTTVGDTPCVAPAGSGGSGGGISGGTMQTGGGVTMGQVNVAFPPNQQVIAGTTAELNGVVTVTLAMPVDISIAFGPMGSPLSNEQKVLTTTLTPVQPGSFKVVYNGLVSGQAYQFVIKNNITGQTSSPMQFTMTGGTAPGGAVTYAGGLFPYTPANPSVSAPGGSGESQQFVDTVSDRGIVPKCGRTQNAEGTIPVNELEMCTYKDFMQLIANVIQYGIVLLGLVVAVMVMYAGFMIITLSWNGDPTADIMNKIRGYQAMLVKIAIGVFIILIAWTIVATILRELGVDASYILLDIVNLS